MNHLIRPLIVTFLVFSALLSAEDSIFQHPRVSELEEKLTKDAGTFLRGRFPSMPFVVTAKLDPLFRTERGEFAYSKGEKLPYFDLDSEEIKDEWDDPDRPLIELLRRVRKTVVSVSLPNSISEAEAMEIKDSLYSVLHLNQARDEIQIARRGWNTAGFHWLFIVLGFGALVLFLGGMTLINRYSVGRIAKALAENKGGSTTVVAPSSPGNSASTRAPSRSEGMGGNVKVNDPLKLKDIVARTIEQLCKKKAFPSRLDLFELDDFGQRNPGALGALLVEFPDEIQARIFSLSSNPCWLEALTSPSTLEFEALEVLQKLARNPHHEKAMLWNETILSIWRLDDEKRAEFVKGLKQEEAFAILNSMPKGIALKTARRAFPGAWAGILEEPESRPVDDNLCEQLRQKAQTIMPLNDSSALRRHRVQLELISHLRHVDAYEERDIYNVLPAGSNVVETRPPFFAILDCDEDVLKRLVPQFSLEHWAMSLRDLKAPDRAKVENMFNDKQRFLYNEKLKAQIGAPLDAETISRTREQIGSSVLRIRNEIQAEQAQAAVALKESEYKMKVRKGMIDPQEPGEKRDRDAA